MNISSPEDHQCETQSWVFILCLLLSNFIVENIVILF